MPFDGEKVVSSNDAIEFENGRKLVVVGAGAIGLELGSVWARLGSEVTVVESLPTIASSFDKDVSKMAERLFKKQGLQFLLKTKVTGIKNESSKTYLIAENQKGETIELEADKILVAVGRKAHTTGLGLDVLGIKTDAKGRIAVDAHFKTNAPGVYAIGDVITGPMLAHKAEEEGVACVECIARRLGMLTMSHTKCYLHLA